MAGPPGEEDVAVAEVEDDRCWPVALANRSLAERLAGAVGGRTTPLALEDITNIYSV